MAQMEFELPVDDQNKATEFKPFKMYGPIPYPRCGRSKTMNPHMRGFWAATLAFMLAFIGWFAFPPLMAVVREDLGLCDNHDRLGTEPCECKAECRKTIGNANIASVSFDVLTRFALGAVIERLGPVNTDCLLLLWGAAMVAASTLITNGTGLIVVRFFVSALGSTFVVNQFWNSILFNSAVVGTANATAGGWGNLGGGLTQLLMPVIYNFWHNVVGLEMHWAWRFSMYVPAVMYLALALGIYRLSQDTTTGPFNIAHLGKKTTAGFGTYWKCIKDVNVLLMVFQYSACFGCELVMNNTLAVHFHDYFGLDLVSAGSVAMSFGGMNLFARSLGGILSDWANKRWAMTGRLWTHFLSLMGQAIFLFLFGSATQSSGWPVAMAALIIFAIFVNMAEGTSFAIVPYMIPEDLAVVSALVGAGGTLGAVIATWAFYKYVDDTLLPYKLHSAYVLFWALTVLLMRWPHLGSMFSGPAAQGALKAPASGSTKARDEETVSEVTETSDEGAVEAAAKLSN